MIAGQGFSTCLICKDDSSLEFNNTLIQNIVKICYDTDEFNVMIQSTRMCSCCIGRFHQLYGFIMFKASLENNHTVECETPDLQCKFCYQTFIDYELMTSDVNLELQNIVSKTLFANDFQLCKYFKSCYACYNFLSLWYEFKEILKECRIRFYSALSNAEVICSSPSVEPGAVKQETPQESNVNVENSDTTVLDKQSQEHEQALVDDNANTPIVLSNTALEDSAFDLSEFLILPSPLFEIESSELGPLVVEDNLSEQAAFIPTIQLTSNSATSLEHSTPIATQYLSTNNSPPIMNEQHFELIPMKKQVRVVIHRLSTDTVEKILGSSQDEQENLPNNKVKRSSRSASRKSTQLKDVNKNVLKRNAKGSALIAVTPNKRKKLNVEAQMPKTDEELLLLKFNIKPCFVKVQKIAVENGAKSKTSAKKTKNLKIKLPLSKEKKKTGARVRSKSVPAKAKPKAVTNSTSNVSKRSVSIPKSLNTLPNLIKSEELPATLVSNEGLIDAVAESYQQQQQQEQIEYNNDVVDHEEVVVDQQQEEEEVVAPQEIHVQSPRMCQESSDHFLYQQPGQSMRIRKVTLEKSPVKIKLEPVAAKSPIVHQDPIRRSMTRIPKANLKYV